jgi:hypothetical protein
MFGNKKIYYFKEQLSKNTTNIITNKISTYNLSHGIDFEINFKKLEFLKY